MQSVGTRLKDARVKKGYTLDEIGARTRINSRNLCAIEFDQVGEISSPFFYRSFVRQYAGEVDLDYHLLAPAVETLAATMRQPDLPGQGEHQMVRVAPIQARPKRDFSWILPTAMFVGVIVLGSGGFAVWKFSKPFPSLQKTAVSLLQFPKADTLLVPAQNAPGVTLPKPAPAQKQRQAADVTQALDVDASTAPVEAEAAADRSSEPKALTDKIHLELAATERTWLSLSADGKPAYTGILEAAETKVVEGQESARLRTGNAGGVNIIFNGKSIGAIGPRGKTRTVVFTRTGYEVQPPEGGNPTPANHIGG